MFNHSHVRHFSSVFVSLRDFQLITQNSSENIASRQSRCIYVNALDCRFIIISTWRLLYERWTALFTDFSTAAERNDTGDIERDKK